MRQHCSLHWLTVLSSPWTVQPDHGDHCICHELGRYSTGKVGRLLPPEIQRWDRKLALRLDSWVCWPLPMSPKMEFSEMGEAGDFKGLRDPPQAPPRDFSFLSRARLFAARGLPAQQNQNAIRQHDDRRDDCDQLNPPSPSRGVPAFIGHADESFEKWPIRSSSPLKAYLGSGKLDRRPGPSRPQLGTR